MEFKYKYESKEGHHDIIEKGKKITKPGKVKNLRINGEFITLVPGQIIKSKTRLYTDDLKLIEEPKKEVKKIKKVVKKKPVKKSKK